MMDERQWTWVVIASMALLLAGCPPNDPEPGEDMGGEPVDMNDSPDMASQEDMSTPPEDMSPQEDMRAPEEDMAPSLALECEQAWSTRATIPRRAGGVSLELSLRCEGADAAQLEGRMEAAVMLEGGEELSAEDVTASQGDAGDLVVTLSVADVDSSGGDRVPIVGVWLEVEGVAERVEVEASGPATHLTLDALNTLHGARASGVASAAPAALAAQSAPIFPEDWAVVTGAMGQEPSLLTATYGSGQITLSSSPFGGIMAAPLSSIAGDAFDATGWASASRGDGSVDHYGVHLCRPEVSGACAAPLQFTRQTFDELGGFVAFERLEETDEIAQYPLDPSVGVLSADVIRGMGEGELRVLYAGVDTLKNNPTWVVADAFAPPADMGGLRRVERVRTLAMLGDVTPDMVASGKARVGLLRSPKAPLDEDEPVSEGQLLAWTASPGKQGGVTFARVQLSGGEAGVAFQPRTFDGIAPGTGAMHHIHWGKDARAILYTGVDETTRRVRAWAAPIDPGTLVETGELRELDLGGVYRVGDDQALDVRVSSLPGDDTRSAIFGVVFGINNTKQQPEVQPAAIFGVIAALNTSKKSDEPPLEALLMDTDTSAIASMEPLRPAGIAPMMLQEGGAPSPLPVPTPGGGVATVAPVDVQACIQTGCSSVHAITPGGAELVRQRARGVTGGEFFLRARASDDPDAPLEQIELLPRDYPDLLFDRRPLLFESTSKEGELTHAVIFSTLGDDGTEGRVLVEVEGGVASTPRELVFKERPGGPGDFSGVEILHYDAATGRGIGGWTHVSVTHEKGELEIFPFSTSGGGDPSQPTTIEVDLLISFGESSSQLPPAISCDEPACAVATTWTALDEGAARVADARGVSGEPVSVEPWPAEAEEAPSAVVIEREEGEGRLCGYVTHFYPRVGRGVDPVALGVSEQADCADLLVPLAKGTFLAGGGEQILLARRELDDRVSLHLLMPAPSADAPGFRLVEFGSIGTLPEDARPVGRTIFAVDVNEDGLLDIAIQAAEGAPLEFLFNDGAGGFIEDVPTPVEGLSVLGVPGGQAFPGAPDPATSGFGSGTKRSTTTTATKPELF